MQGKLSELIRDYSTPYSKRLTRSPSDAREYAALVDFHIKVALTLLAAYGTRTAAPLKLGDTPGVGEMLSGIKLARKWGASQDPVIVGWREFAEGFLGEFSRNIHAGKNFKTIRDELSHGTPIPAEDVSAASICNALREFSEETASRLEAQLRKFTYMTSATSIKSVCGTDEQELCPVWDANIAQGVIGIYSSFDSDGVYYLCPAIGAYRNQRPENTHAFREGFLGKDPTARHFGQFVYEITRDIAGFSEDHSPPPYDFGEGQHAGVVFVTWTQPSSQGNVHRTDMFRRGPDNRYEWLDPAANTWVGYSGFLRGIANWGVLARRVRIELEEQERRKQIAETGITQSIAGNKVPAVLVEESDSQSSAPEDIDLQLRVDAACLPSKSFTTVFFVVGDAGMGKTELLLTLARERALAVEVDPTSDAPLYLFVSSTGRALSNLDDAINTSLSITRILDSQSAKALCRNGMLVLIVDGFDELLGSSGYDNPLGSLEGWFRDLRGRGVMIASARSAYYMTRYRRALNETTNLNVEHTVANIQPWTRPTTEAFLKSYGVQDQALAALGDQDWHLLTIPFFAKAFATWCMSRTSVNADSRGIFQVVVEQYLEREAKKILDHTNVPILTMPELQVLFSEFAEMMHLEGERELEHSDLELCASICLGLNDLDKERPGLKRRLTSLCGLSAGELITGNSNFGFSHEVISDCFLSLALQRRCKAGVDKTYVGNFFAASAIHPAVIEWFVANNPDSARKALDILVRIEGASPIWKKNVGSLWTALLDHYAGMPPNFSASGLVFQTIKLTKGQGDYLEIRNARIDQLFLSRGAAAVDVKDTPISYLQVDDTSTLELLRNVAPELIHEFKSPDTYCDTTPEIRAALEEAGVIEREAGAAAQQWLDTANYFIEALMSRPDAPIVVFSDNFESDGNRLGWTRRLGLTKWTEFVSRLTHCNLASWEIINAKGRPKSRLVFQVTPADIARRNSSISGVADFWGDC
ncbi:NACHT domain-containing protein [Hydrogenophaga sp. SL48]|uniref:NACHT domain-containing protein n=1 Tax=Hydrogenophaga sp. SL48 TaxID=2806347 RepID=UPI001F3AB70A|nr:NACHT domain-containing protein [Hydrogenophaga sp. SL48]UJW80618.1 NACHT domain-containing protein [Hydrogenophaga sp. SL48]